MENANQPTDEQVLSEIIPGALVDGTLLIELISDKDNGVKNGLLLTLYREDCPLEDKPKDETPAKSIWCWNTRTKTWYDLQFADIGSAQSWPLMPEPMG
jgi:hypothetical protein